MPNLPREQHRILCRVVSKATKPLAGSELVFDLLKFINNLIVQVAGLLPKTRFFFGLHRLVEFVDRCFYPGPSLVGLRKDRLLHGILPCHFATMEFVVVLCIDTKLANDPIFGLHVEVVVIEVQRNEYLIFRLDNLLNDRFNVNS